MLGRSEAKPSEEIAPAVLDGSMIGSMATRWRNALLLFTPRYSRFLLRDRPDVTAM